ncbi:sex comb on midleg-like protein 4 isoform X2 [Myotis daubentonii]|uniref:sex comb on midleg-like protein 4 isoform X2 n=1 Tax=Myotis daubentonii TaxID=98922 RepID=UPI002872D29B|nr:sex comb on midleg-like protein 4 isoform X2 [Myotis daubentonii]
MLSLIGGVAWCPLNREGWDKRPPRALRENTTAYLSQNKGRDCPREGNLQTSSRASVRAARGWREATVSAIGSPGREASLPPAAAGAGVGTGGTQRSVCGCLVAASPKAAARLLGMVRQDRPGSPGTALIAASLPAFRLAKTFATAECRLATAAGMSRYSLDPAGPAFSHRGSVPPASALYCKRQNSGDGPLGGGPAAGGPRTSPLSSGGPSAPGLRPPGCSPKRNGTSLEGNRCASSPSPDGQDGRRPRSRNPSTWTVEDVVRFVKDADPQALGPHVELFRKHEIDGNALLLLKSDMIMKYLGLKLGPALKLCYHIDKLKQAKF